MLDESVIVVLVFAIRAPSRFVAKKKWTKKNVKWKLCKLLGFLLFFVELRMLLLSIMCIKFTHCIQMVDTIDSRQHSIVTIHHCDKNTNRFYSLRVETSRRHSAQCWLEQVFHVICSFFYISLHIYSQRCWIKWF